jgi:hypothetical protein
MSSLSINAYDSPITLMPRLSRKHMCGVALTVADTGRLGESRNPIRGLFYRNTPFRKHAEVAHLNSRAKEHFMLDIVMLALGLGLFVAAIGYAHACERL